MSSTKRNSNESSLPVSYEGKCHCEAVQYSATFTSPFSDQRLVSCNCSYCSIAGTIHAVVQDMQISQGTEALQEYRFGSQSIQIFFCGTCGANVYNKSLNPKWAYGTRVINVRLIRDVDLEALQVAKVDNKNFQLPPLEENSI